MLENLKGWKTIIFMILTAILAGIDSLSELVNIPSWYFMFIVPFVGVLLRYLTTTPLGKKA